MKVSMYHYSSEDGWKSTPDSSLDSENTLLLFFGASDLSKVSDIISTLRKDFSQSVFFGCSSAGEIFDSYLYEQGISLAIIQFEKTMIRFVQEELGDSVSTGKILAGKLNDESLKLVLVLSDGLQVNGSALLKSLTANLDDSVVITGGLAADDDRFESTWTWCNDGLRDGCVTAVGLYGENLGIGYGSRGGWDVLGTEREVTRSKENILFELDGQPALELYRKYLGDRAAGLPATGLLFPLAIKNDEENDGYTVRTILAINEKESSITFAGDLPEGSTVRLMSANFDRLIDGAVDAAESINSTEFTHGDAINIAISCVGRKLVLGQRTEEEIEAAREGLPDNVRQIGFYSYGEISPLASGRCDLHNQTMTLTMLWET